MEKGKPGKAFCLIYHASKGPVFGNAISFPDLLYRVSRTKLIAQFFLKLFAVEKNVSNKIHVTSRGNILQWLKILSRWSCFRDFKMKSLFFFFFFFFFMKLYTFEFYSLLAEFSDLGVSRSYKAYLR